jgi:phosphoesterase RecJ-like protein
VLAADVKLPEHDVLILTDCSTLDRLGPVGTAVRPAGAKRLVVDHHVDTPQGDGDVLLWDVDACSSGALVYDLIREAGAPLTAPAAEGVFVSIVADTGWFRYSNTSDDALAICADLVAHGVRPHEIYNALYRSKPVSSVALLTEGLGFAYFTGDGRVAVCPLPRHYMQRVESEHFNTDDLLEPLRSVRGVDVVLLLKERRDGRVKISLRASDRVDVDGVARGFGGGGHRKAAGADLEGPLASATERTLRAVVDLTGA